MVTNYITRRLTQIQLLLDRMCKHFVTDHATRRLTGTLVRLDRKVRPPARVVSSFSVGGPMYRFSRVPSSPRWFSLLWRTSDDMFFMKGSLSSTYPTNCRQGDRAVFLLQQGILNFDSLTIPHEVECIHCLFRTLYNRCIERQAVSQMWQKERCIDRALGSTSA